MKKLFYWWAYMDLDHKCEKKKSYFYEHADEAARKNLLMVKSLSVFISIIGVAVIIMSLTFFDAPKLALIYLGIMVLEGMAFLAANVFEKRTSCINASNILSSVYLLHMLIIGAVIGTVYSQKESAVVYVVVLVISQMLFIQPPVLTTSIAALSMIITFILSYNYKSSIYFKSDIINCVGVFILSILLGWRIMKIRIEESEARDKAVSLSMELKKLSLVDQLTNLYNHRSFQNEYYRLYNQLKSTDAKIGIIMMDIDKFKAYNDGYGHLEGDECLKNVGKCLKQFENESTILFRFGGEEFVAIIKSDKCDDINRIAEKIRKAVEDLSISHKYSSVADVVTISAGCYLGKPSETASPTELVDYADKALYRSKKSGGNKSTTWI